MISRKFTNRYLWLTILKIKRTYYFEQNWKNKLQREDIDTKLLKWIGLLNISWPKVSVFS